MRSYSLWASHSSHPVCFYTKSANCTRWKDVRVAHDVQVRAASVHSGGSRRGTRRYRSATASSPTRRSPSRRRAGARAAFTLLSRSGPQISKKAQRDINVLTTLNTLKSFHSQRAGSVCRAAATSSRTARRLKRCARQPVRICSQRHAIRNHNCAQDWVAARSVEIASSADWITGLTAIDTYPYAA